MASSNTFIPNGEPAVAQATRRHPGMLALPTLSTNASFTAIGTELAAVTEPVADASTAVIYPGNFNSAVISPFCTDTDGDTSYRRIYVVRAIQDLSGAITGYKRELLVQLIVTASTTVASQTITGAASCLYCDTIAPDTYTGYPFDPAGFTIRSNTLNIPGSISFDVFGFAAVEIKYAINGGSAVAMNDFYALL